MARPRPCSRSTEGYTLFELAVVLLIMGSMAMMIVPGLSEQLADARASGAAEDLVRLNRVLRARVNQTGLAHLMTFYASDDARGAFGLGRLQVWEGMNNRCIHTPWNTTITGNPLDGHQAVDELDLGHSAYNLPIDGHAPRFDDVGRQVVRMQASTNAAVAILCFEPGGATYRAAVDAGLADVGFSFTPQTAAETFTVARRVPTADGPPDSGMRGVVREVIFPPGGNGRLRF